MAPWRWTLNIPSSAMTMIPKETRKEDPEISVLPEGHVSLSATLLIFIPILNTSPFQFKYLSTSLLQLF